MKILPFVASSQPTLSAKVTRLSCCCRISELMPLVRQLHDQARAARQAREEGQGLQQAA
jgi:hypothetical protein